MRRLVAVNVFTVVILLGLFAAGANVVTPQRPVGIACPAAEVLVRISTTWVCISGSLPK